MEREHVSSRYLEDNASFSFCKPNLVPAFHDFPRIPKKDDVPAHKYRRDAVRKKDERKKLEGWDCADCKRYYASRVNDSAERKQLMDKCSKHRDRFKRNDTPPDYWNPEFPTSPELRARNLDVTQKPQKFRTRKRH